MPDRLMMTRRKADVPSAASAIGRALLMGVLLLGGPALGLAQQETLSTENQTRPRAEKRQVIGELAVQGNVVNKKKAVLSKVKARKGDVIVDPSFRADVDRLIETGLFDEVEVAQEEMTGSPDAQGLPKVRVIFIVKERPIIKRIDFKGNLKLGDQKFREKISSKQGEPMDRFKVSQDEQQILSIYHEEGYADATVESYTSVHLKSRKVILTFYVIEGNRILIKSVNVEGNKIFSDKNIRKVMKKTRRKKVFKEENLRNDLDEIMKFYKNRGYLEVNIGPPARALNEDRTSIDLTLYIEEGRRYTVGKFSFSGATLFSQKELQKAMALKPGQLYRQDKFDDSMQNLRDMYADKGYLRAEILPEPVTQTVDDKRGIVDYHFSITESSVVYVDRIYIDGNTYTKEKVIRREVLLKEGDVFSAGRLRRSVESIYNLGFLDDVQVDVQQPRSPTLADLVFSVAEGKPGILSAGAGYSSVDGLLGTLQVQHINLFGRAQRLNLMWEFGQRKQNYEIGWTDPWFMGKRMSFGVDLFNTIRVIPTGLTRSAYKLQERGSSLRLGPRLTDRLSLIHSYSYKQVKRFDIDPVHVSTDANQVITESNDIYSSVVNGIAYDSRDNYFDASRGMRHSLTVDVTGGPFGGNINFYKPEMSSALYFPTFWKFVFSVSGRGGYVHRFGESKNVPDQELFRFFGQDDVRGYDSGVVGEPGGGKYQLIFNAEYKFPIVQERGRTILQAAFFADAGGAWRKRQDIDLRIGSQGLQMRSSVGFGIRFKTPVFPIRLDWAYPLNLRPGESANSFIFNIGSIF